MEDTIIIRYKWSNEDKYGDLVCELTEFFDKYILDKNKTYSWYKTYLYNDYSKVVSWREHYDKNNGKNLYSDDNFEEKNEIIKRVKSVLEKYNNYKKVIVVTHGMVINALTGISKPECAHFYKYSLNK